MASGRSIKKRLQRLLRLKLGIMVYVLTCAISSCQIKTRPAVKSAISELNRASPVKTANFDAAAEKKIYEGNWSSTYIEKGKASKMVI